MQVEIHQNMLLKVGISMPPLHDLGGFGGQQGGLEGGSWARHGASFEYKWPWRRSLGQT